MIATLRPLALIVALAAATPALATTINFDQLPDGSTLPVGYDPTGETLISNQYASLGVTFTGTYGNGTTGSPVATAYAAGPAGPNYSGNFLGNSTSGQFYRIVNGSVVFVPRYQVTSILFTGGADDVSLSHNNFSNTSTTFNAYGATGNLLGSTTYTSSGGWTVLSFAYDDIYRLDMVATVTSTPALAYNFFGIDNLNYTLNAVVPGGVPEPATWAMMIGGFGCVGGALRGRAKAKTAAA